MTQLHMKQWFIALSLIVFVTMTLRIFYEPSQLNIVRNTVRENLNNFAEIGLETVRQDEKKDIKSSTSKAGLSSTEKVTTSLNKLSPNSKCGYDASLINSFDLLFLFYSSS